MKNLLFTIAFLLLGIMGLYAQPQVAIGTVSGSQGQIISVPVTVTGCDATTGGTGITGIELHFTYSDAVQYYGTTNYYSGIPSGEWMPNGNGTEFATNWSSSTYLPYDIPDGTTLFEVQFIAYNGGTSDLNFTKIGTNTILLDANFDIIAGTTWNNGSATIPTAAAVTTWNSAAAASWFTSANWSNGFPGHNSNVVIASGTITVDNAAALCNNLTVNGGAAMTINSGITVNVPGNFTLESDATHTRSGSLINNGTLNVTGNRTVKRWLEGGKNHFISTPLRIGTTINTIYDPSNNGWTYRWDEPTATWVNMYELTDPLIVGNGYCVNYTQGETLSFSITDNPGFNAGTTYNPTTTYTDVNKGWNLVGNPFTATLNWLGSGWTKTKIDNAVYFFNGTTYASFVGGSSVNGGTQYIPAMQGFFVHTNGSSPNFIMPKASLVHNAQEYYKDEEMNALRINVQGNGYSDESMIKFDAASSNNFDSDFDAYKILGMNEDVPQIFSYSADTNYSINCLSEISSNLVIPVAVRIGVNGIYTLNASQLESFNSNVSIYLEDTCTNTFTDLRDNSSYSFQTNEGCFNRFKIHFNMTTGIKDPQSNILVYTSGKNIFIKNIGGVAEIYNLEGQKVAMKTLVGNSMNTINLNNVNEGVYLVKVVNGSSAHNVKVFVK